MVAVGGTQAICYNSLMLLWSLFNGLIHTETAVTLVHLSDAFFKIIYYNQLL